MDDKVEEQILGHVKPVEEFGFFTDSSVKHCRERVT